MKLRYYHGLDPDNIPNFQRFTKAIEADDPARVAIRKIGDNPFCMKLGRSARLLFAFHSHAGQAGRLADGYFESGDGQQEKRLTTGLNGEIVIRNQPVSLQFPWQVSVMRCRRSNQ